jgi:RNA polymerase sigma-54 factor
MQVSQDQSQNIIQSQKIAPHLIQASEILQCSNQELIQAIERELMENPALESAETSTEGCVECPKAIGLCANCPRRNQADASFSPTTDPNQSTQDNASEQDSSDGPVDDDYVDYVSVTDNEERFDPISLKPSSTNLRDHLLSGLRSMASPGKILSTAEYLVNCLDERGWLKYDEVEVLAVLDIDHEILSSATRLLQSCDPPGIGARDLRDCLLLQLRHLESEGTGHPLATQLVDQYWDSLAQRRYDQTARKLKTTRDAIEEAVKFIQGELSPDPAGQYRQPWEYKPDTQSDTVRPDVIIRRIETGFEIEVASLQYPGLNVSARYRKLYEQIKSGTANGNDVKTARLSLQERRHIVQYVERADIFLKNLLQRQKTIERITRFLIEAQQGFVDTGSRSFLLPLTRTELARRTGLHESTVSRALLHKYVQLPSQEVLQFDSFFASAGSAKEAIASMIAEESPEHPLSDEALRQELKEIGIDLARRTIVKYREALRIPASYLRRRR